MARCKKLSIILILFFLASLGKCEEDNGSTSEDPKSSVSTRQSEDDDEDVDVDDIKIPLTPRQSSSRKHTTKYSEIPNGYKVSSSSEESDNYSESSETNDGYTTTTIRENGRPARHYTRYTPDDDYGYGHQRPHYQSYGGGYGQPNGGYFGYRSQPQPYGYNQPPPPPPPPYYGNQYPYHMPPYSPPPNYYNMPPPNMNSRNLMSFGDNDSSDDFDSEYLKGIFRGYEMGKRMRADGGRTGHQHRRRGRRPQPKRSNIRYRSPVFGDLLERII